MLARARSLRRPRSRRHTPRRVACTRERRGSRARPRLAGFWSWRQRRSRQTDREARPRGRGLELQVTVDRLDGLRDYRQAQAEAVPRCFASIEALEDEFAVARADAAAVVAHLDANRVPGTA